MSEPPVMLPEPLTVSVWVSVSVKLSEPPDVSVVLSPEVYDPAIASLWTSTWVSA